MEREWDNTCACMCLFFTSVEVAKAAVLFEAESEIGTTRKITLYSSNLSSSAKNNC